MVMPHGLEKRAALKTPSTHPAFPVPAYVETTPRGERYLTRWLFESVRYTPLVGNASSTAIPVTPLKAAEDTAPSAYAALLLPATVVTRPVGLMARMSALPVSARSRNPLELSDIPLGLKKLARTVPST